MPTEVATYIGELDGSRPQGSESLGEADDHVRLTKNTITTSFPGNGTDDLWDTALIVGPRYLNDLLNTYTPDNWVTLDTEQTITAKKTHTATIQADAGIDDANGANLIGNAVGVTGVGNTTDETVIYASANDTLTQGWEGGSAVVLNTANLLAQMLDVLYPIGSVYHSTTPTDPGTHLGGTWARVGEGRFIASVGSHTDGNADAFNVPAGDIVEGEYNHTLTEAEMPTHTHNSKGGDAGGPLSGSNANYLTDRFLSGQGTTYPLEDTGGGGAHNNIPPGYGLYVWERTA